MKILLLAHGNNDIPHNRCCSKDASVILKNITEADELYTVDISSKSNPTQVVNLCRPSISVKDSYFDIVIDCGGLISSMYWYKSLYFWKEIIRVISSMNNFYPRYDVKFDKEKYLDTLRKIKCKSFINVCECEKFKKYTVDVCCADENSLKHHILLTVP